MEIKIPFYNILNMFLTGLVFMGGCAMVYPDHAAALLKSDVVINMSTGPEIVFTVCTFAAAYEVGLIINRIGSVIIEPLFKKIKAIPFNNDYVKFNQKKKEYPIMSTLSREYGVSRTGIVLFGLLSAVALYGKNTFLTWVFLGTAVVYWLSARKHSQKIVDLVTSTDEKDSKENGDKE